MRKRASKAKVEAVEAVEEAAVEEAVEAVEEEAAVVEAVEAVAPEAAAKLGQAQVNAQVIAVRKYVAGLHVPTHGQPRTSAAWQALADEAAELSSIAAALAAHFRPVEAP